MRILIVGKYPPIEGGVSARTYWLARGFAEEGDTVSIVTNADRVEGEYQMALNRSSKDYVPRGVSLYTQTHKPPMHIPFSEGFVTRLVNDGLRAIEERGADVLYAHYLEPYGVAALFLKKMTGLPLVVRHAGSDIHRLLRDRHYKLILGRVLQQADAALVGSFLMPSMRSLGARALPMPKSALHPLFSRDGSRMQHALVEGARLPRVLYLGKAAKHKGLLEMLDVCEKGDFALTLVTQGPLTNAIRARIGASEKLQARVDLRGFVPPWEVPALLRGSDLLMQLENKFAVPIHTPSQPYEAIACGTPLLLSAEVYRKFGSLYPKENFSIVEDPEDTDELARVVDAALSVHAKERAHNAHELYLKHNDWNAYLAAHREIFKNVRATGLRRFLRIRR